MVHRGCVFTATRVVLLIFLVTSHTYVYIRLYNIPTEIDATGQLRHDLVHFHHMSAVYGLGDTDSDLHVEAYGHHLQQTISDGTCAESYKQYPIYSISHALGYIHNVTQFYRSHGIDTSSRNSLVAAMALRVNSTNKNMSNAIDEVQLHTIMQMHVFLTDFRHGDEWLQVIGALRDSNTMISTAVRSIDTCVKVHVKDSKHLMAILFSISGLACTLLIVAFGCMLHLHHLLRKVEHYSIYKQVLRNLNHELKGVLCALQGSAIAITDVAIIPPALKEELNDMEASLMHIGYSLSSLSYRCEPNHESARRIHVNMSKLADTVRGILPQLEVYASDTMGSDCIMGDPSLVYAILYQLCRNACVHGSPPYVLRIRAREIVVENGHGAASDLLTNLSNEDALQRCLSGDMGTIASSGFGLRDVIDLCDAFGITFTLTFLPHGVRAMCTWPDPPNTLPSTGATLSGVHPAPVLCVERMRALSTDTRGTTALLILDDQVLPRIQGAPIFKGLNPFHPPLSVKLNRQNSTCHLSHLKVCGVTARECEPGEIVDWLLGTYHDEAVTLTVAILDYLLEFGSGVVISGTSVLAEIVRVLRTKQVNMSKFLIVVRSGNDTHKDEAIYIEAGADMMLSKSLSIGDVIKRIQGGRPT